MGFCVYVWRAALKRMLCSAWYEWWIRSLSGPFSFYWCGTQNSFASNCKSQKASSFFFWSSSKEKSNRETVFKVRLSDWREQSTCQWEPKPCLSLWVWASFPLDQTIDISFGYSRGNFHLKGVGQRNLDHNIFRVLCLLYLKEGTCIAPKRLYSNSFTKTACAGDGPVQINSQQESMRCRAASLTKG